MQAVQTKDNLIKEESLKVESFLQKVHWNYKTN